MTYSLLRAAMTYCHITKPLTQLSLPLLRAGVKNKLPKLVVTYLVNGDWRVLLTALVVVTYSEPGAIFELACQVEPDAGTWSANWNAPWTVVTLTHDPFRPGTAFTMTVTEAPAFKANPLLDAPVSWRFSTPFELFLPLVLS